MRRQLLAAAALGVLTACSPSPSELQRKPAPSRESPGDVRDMAVSAAPQAAPAAEAESPAAANEPGQSAPVGAPLLAYRYNADLEAPANRVEALMKSHERACQAAGFQRCQVIGSSVSDQGDDFVNAQLTLRAAPEWLKSFRTNLEADAKAANGRLAGQSMESEDLTRQIIDTQARLDAQKTLRDRLQQILASRPGKLQELLETERELARVQGELDSAESILKEMRQRVETSLMTLDYRTRPSAVSQSALDPIADAATNFLSVMAHGFAALITLTAALIPWLVVLLPAGWAGLRWWRGRRGRKAAEKAAG